MATLTIGLAVLGLVLLFAAPLLARLLMRGGEPVALTRGIQLFAAALLVIALLVRPHNPDTAAFPPSPDQEAADER